MKLRDIVDFLNKTYCGAIGWEISHIMGHDRLVWMRQKAESFLEFRDNYPYENKLTLLKRLEEVTSFEE
jgi:2-oxoglutarate dehydrogenase E1 component